MIGEHCRCVHATAARKGVFDPPVQVGAAWPVRLPSSLIRLQADDALPEFETSFELGEPETDFEPSAPGISSDPVF